jgi:hypothetical protein
MLSARAGTLSCQGGESMASQAKVDLWDHDIKIGKILGKGSFAHVYRGLWNDTAVAIKVIEYGEGVRDAVNPLPEASLSKCAPPLPLYQDTCQRPGPAHHWNIQMQVSLCCLACCSAACACCCHGAAR